MSKTRTGRAQGFTLIELMVVVSVIALIAAMAIPLLRSARKSGNEVNAIAALRTVHSMEESYRSRIGTYGTIPQLVGQGLIDETFLSSPRHGYALTESGAPTPHQFAIDASPSVLGQTGDRFFFVDESGVIRFETAAAASAASPALD